jgi:hypothetical protein
MPFFANTMFHLFVTAWCAGIAGLLCWARFTFSLRADGLRELPARTGDSRKARIGLATLLGAALLGTRSVGLAQLDGGFR